MKTRRSLAQSSRTTPAWRRQPDGARRPTEANRAGLANRIRRWSSSARGRESSVASVLRPPGIIRRVPYDYTRIRVSTYNTRPRRPLWHGANIRRFSRLPQASEIRQSDVRGFFLGDLTQAGALSRRLWKIVPEANRQGFGGGDCNLHFPLEVSCVQKRRTGRTSESAWDALFR